MNHPVTFLWQYQFQYSRGRKEGKNIQTKSAWKTTQRCITEELGFSKPNSVKAAGFFHGLLMRVEPEIYTLKIFQQSFMCHRKTYFYTVAQNQLKKHILRIISSSYEWKWEVMSCLFALLLALIFNLLTTWRIE